MTLTGTTVGRIRVTEALGKGGMGEVYAGYDEKLQRKVALKAIRDERRLDAEAKARFLREARILSQLDHPAICRIHELIEGDDAGEPPLERTVQWSGVQRSVEEQLDPAPKTSASGGASSAQPHRARSLLHKKAETFSVQQAPGGAPGGTESGISTPSDFVETQRGIVMGTVAYMSPEQARGERVTEAGDLYSLGLLMQELFTGQSPYKEDLALLEMLRSAATATTRPVTGVDPDLGELIERCKSLDPADRPSAAETSERLRWIRGKPGRRLLRRLAAVVLAVLLLGGLKYTFDLRRERAEAEAARQEAEDVLGFVVGLFAVSNPESALGREITARELLDAGAAEIAGALGDQPRSQSRLMLTMGRIYRQLGVYERARALLEEGLAIRRRELGGEDLEIADALDQLAGLYTDQGDYVQAEPLFRRALEIREQELGSGHPHVAASLNNLAFHHLARDQREAAEPLLLRALEIQQRARGDDHADVANSLVNLGELYRGRGELERAEPFLRRALAVQERLLPADHPDLAFSLNSLAMIHFARGRHHPVEPRRPPRRQG